MSAPAFRLHGQVAHVLPWAEMSARQQAEHLVFGHGLNAEYWGGYDHPELDTDAKVVDWCRIHWLDRGREVEHDGDHDEYTHGGSEHCPHVHDKTT